MKILHLNLKFEYWDAIKSGEKTEEYREVKKHWIKKLTYRKQPPLMPYIGLAAKENHKAFDEIHIRRGYLSGDENIIKCKWRGFYLKDNFTHPHFGDDPVDVFAIDVSEKI